MGALASFLNFPTLHHVSLGKVSHPSEASHVQANDKTRPGPQGVCGCPRDAPLLYHPHFWNSRNVPRERGGMQGLAGSQEKAGADTGDVRDPHPYHFQKKRVLGS